MEKIVSSTPSFSAMLMLLCTQHTTFFLPLVMSGDGEKEIVEMLSLSSKESKAWIGGEKNYKIYICDCFSRTIFFWLKFWEIYKHSIKFISTLFFFSKWLIIGDRQSDLKDERRRAQMSAARLVLERSTMMLLTSSKVRLVLIPHLICISCIHECTIFFTRQVWGIPNVHILKRIVIPFFVKCDERWI